MAGLAIVDAALNGERVGLRAEDGQIAELGAGVAVKPGDEVVDAGGMEILAPLVNHHTHAAMTLFRGYGDDMPLLEWLEERIWPIEAKLTDDDVYWGARLACAEMIRTGTTRFWDMYWHPAATARAVEDSGIRAVIGKPLIDGGDPDRTGEVRESAEESLEQLSSFGDRIDTALCPHAIYTVSEPSLEWIAETSAERGIPIHIHLSETEGEVHDCVAARGERPAAYLDRVGMLGGRTALAHSVWVDGDELDAIASRGSTLVTNPVANMKLAVGGVFPYRDARDRGIPVALGTDGAGSNNALDLFSDVKAFALLQKHEAADPAAVTAEEAWEIATGSRSPLSGASGRIEVGGPADLLLLRGIAPELGLGELSAADLVYAASGSLVDTTVVDGRVLMRGGEIEGIDEIVARARERAESLGTV